MVQPLVCICVPSFNAQDSIIETMDTIRSQTYSNIEIHIFDNASNDKTVAIIKAIADERIYIHQAESTGTAESNFTRCLNLGRGDYTAIFHADDLYAPNIIEKEVELLEKNRDTSGILTFATQIDEQGREGQTYLAPRSLNVKRGEIKLLDAVSLFKAVLENDNFLFCPSAMIRTRVCIEELKEWKGTQFKSSADLDVWLRLAAYDQVALLNEPLLFYRVGENQYTAEYRKKRKVRADIFLVLDYWLKKDKIKKSITDVDMLNYLKLQRYDALGRMLNAVRANENLLAKDIWLKEKSFSIVTEFLQIRTARDLKFYMLSISLRLMLLPLIGCVLSPMFLRYLGRVRV